MALLRRGGRPLWWVLALGLALRVGVALWPAFYHPDEIWQYLEPARHVLGKPWIATWEARSGARGWLLPVVFGGPLALGQWIAPGTFLPVILPRLACVALSLAAVLAAAGLGFRLSRRHGMAAAFVAAIWYEQVYFGARTLSEPIATALILIAAWLLQDRRARALVVAGLLLGLACAIRFQYSPAAVVLALWTLRRDWRAWAQVVAGGIAGLAVSGLADLAMGAVPFAWVLRNLSLNLIENRSAHYGVEPWYWYAVALWQSWGPFGLAILVLAGVGARRYPALAAAAIVTLAAHALIPHKEARFILLSTTLLVTLAAIGAVDAAARWRTTLGARVFALAWATVSVTGVAWGTDWGNNARLEPAWRSAATVPGLCGVGVYRTPPLVASHALFARDAPLYQFDESVAARRSRAFNVAVTAFAHQGELPGYRAVSCSGARPYDLCVSARPGPCAPSPRDRYYAVDAVLVRLGY